MYPSAPLPTLTYSTRSFRSVIVVHKWNGFLDAVEADDDALFFVEQKKRIHKAHPELTESEVEKLVVVQERIANCIFDVWLNKRNKKTA